MILNNFMGIKKTFGGLVTKILAPAILTVPLIFLPLEKANAQFQINPYAQPNDTTMVYHASCDVDSNNVRNWNDHTLITQGIQNMQSDVDGDGVYSTSQDAELFSRYLNSDTLLPQINWAWADMTLEQRMEWLEKMLAIDKTDTIPPVQGEWMCGQYSTQTIINFHGFSELKDSTIASNFPKYNLNNNGEFNLPVYNVSISWGGPIGHFINAVLIGENPLNFNDFYLFDVSRHDKEVFPGDVLMPDNSKVTINHSFFSKDGISRYSFVRFKLNNGVPSLDGDPSQYLITERPPVSITQEFTKTSLENFVLKPIYPNPLNSKATIEYNLPKPGNVLLNIYNIKGDWVETVSCGKQDQGTHRIQFDAKNLRSGQYFYEIATQDYKKSMKMLILK